MPDHRRPRGGEGRIRINMREESEVEYWAKAFGVSKERLAAAVKKVGDSVRAVRTELLDNR